MTALTVCTRVQTRLPLFRFRWEISFFSALPIGGVLIFLSVAGCRSPEGNAPTQASAKPNFGPPMQDVRTEAKIIEMENEYNAAKNSRPTHQAEAQAEAAKKAQEKQAKEKAARDTEKTNPEPEK